MGKGKTEVIVIGAGISGIKASLDLANAGISSLVLESRGRLGGRLCTEQMESGLSVDMGASWFHDCYTNPLLKKYWESGKVDFHFDDGKFSYFNEEGLVDENKRLEPVAKEIELFMEDLYTKIPADKDISIKEAVYQYLKDKKWCLTDYQLKHVPQLVRYFEMWIGSSWEILSARTIATDKHKGRDAMVMNGYSTVYNGELEELVKAAKLSSQGGCSIKLNSVVYKIEWDAKKREIVVHSKNSLTNKSEQFRSNFLVFTAPLSVLKLTDLKEEGAIEWTPPLPPTLRNSLDKVSFSNLGKVFFEFPETFWNLEDDRILSLARGKIPNGLDYTILFLNLAKPTQKPLLLALISSPLTQYIEQQESQEVIFEVFKPVLSRITNLKASEIPKPLQIKTSKWSADPYARGSYTGVTVRDDYEVALEYLMNPTGIFDGSGRVRFAGEGVTDDGNGCAHGAWVSGAREAEYIKRVVNKAKF
ncbi:hypothetical protein PICMEDRAFT_33738 [Pichia membranifaciens NRRL Y-2026]|uniref:Amine oxidase domain-containing protein n=1 Tax=Pichia membranifaciens NRRL Y-2026 TaxID=763406 RepID=A0A1E3NMX9_9ASCO|nr:hypothetical protein PICMEDRAFT_33738 [Pichia membranifaciens NRRL Y-2026]ODQ46978.1 hypothetical protein PICMEDRAFT_33738 [Pichia membranifaciens NRRL Y-2026]